MVKRRTIRISLTGVLTMILIFLIFGGFMWRPMYLKIPRKRTYKEVSTKCYLELLTHVFKYKKHKELANTKYTINFD
jgi:hypothetical protein